MILALSRVRAAGKAFSALHRQLRLAHGQNHVLRRPAEFFNSLPVLFCAAPRPPKNCAPSL
jgi:hypothetical protein